MATRKETTLFSKYQFIPKIRDRETSYFCKCLSENKGAIFENANAHKKWMSREMHCQKLSLQYLEAGLNRNLSLFHNTHQREEYFEKRSAIKTTLTLVIQLFLWLQCTTKSNYQKQLKIRIYDAIVDNYFLNYLSCAMQ